MGYSDKAPYFIMTEDASLAFRLQHLNNVIMRARKEIAAGVFPKHAQRGYPTQGSVNLYIREYRRLRGQLIRELGFRSRGR